VTAPRDSLRYRLRVASAGALGALLLRALGATWRVRTSGPDPFARGEPVVGAMWHEGLLVAAWRWRGRDFAVPVSRSRDGDLIDAVLARLGFGPSPRGSSSRGAASLLRAMVRAIRDGRTVAVLVDGPRGPARRAKPGAVLVAHETGAALVPVGVAARPALRFGSWDRAFLPLPFARVRCVYGEPLHLPKKAHESDIEGWRVALETTLDALQAAAARELEGTPAPEGARP